MQLAKLDSQTSSLVVIPDNGIKKTYRETVKMKLLFYVAGESIKKEVLASEFDAMKKNGFIVGSGWAYNQNCLQGYEEVVERMLVKSEAIPFDEEKRLKNIRILKDLYAEKLGIKKHIE